ncbi:E3 ubiquitin-protein ligase Topors-like [Sceloporus undulatus]|uniref:E3 ubiquitin-protein ligase Topors-like n=1 Tax=Sceloporus undulatus TaxID=8520 RepID=UPI001C4CA6C2|nr:E3 ubiquitin-protein ligase Topors-like [Sceloporus undulatus]
MCDPRELRSRAFGAKTHRRQRSKPNLASLTNHLLFHFQTLASLTNPLASDSYLATDSFSPKFGTNKLHQTMSSSDASPDSKCPICLDRFENVAYLDRCWHRFCFRCVQEWSKNKAECPLCKQPFHSIVHSMRSENHFKVYTVKPSETDSFANPDGRRFRYRTTVTRERRASSYSRRNPTTRRTASPPDNGILFEGLSGQTTGQRNAEISHMIRRLQSRRQANLEGRSMRQIQEQEIINFRRALYRAGTRVRSIEDGGRYRDISAEFFRRNPACLHRLVPWLKRELTVLFGAHGSLVNIVQHIIMSNVTRYDLESQAFADELKPFLLHRTEHFLHEFINFARCPFNIEAYDQHANYDCPAPSYEEGSRSESSIITISPDEADSQEAEGNAFTAGTDQAPWDDETPGPSYSSSDQVCATLSTALGSSESSDEEPSTNTAELLPQVLQPSVETNGDSCDSPENCVIVGYVKPLAERTPELVELSSDSEESVADGGKGEDVQKVKPIQYQSFSDTDASGYASPFSLGSRDGSVSCKANVSQSSKKRKSKRSEKGKSKTSENGCLQNSPTERDYDYYDDDYSLSKRRKSESYTQHSVREHRGLKSKNKDRGMEKQKRRRESSRHKHKKDKKKSRTRDKSLSRKSQVLSLSNESIDSQELSRSRSHSKEYSKRSKSKESDNYFRDSYQSKYDWEYGFRSRNTSRDSYRRRTPYSRHSSPDYGVRSFSERTNNRKPKDHSRNYYYERNRPRSRSSSRSRTPSRGSDRIRSEKPSGKRKYKTRHLEGTRRDSEETSSIKENSILGNLLPKRQDAYKRTGSILDSPPEPEVLQKKLKKMSRSPSVEIIYEGMATDMIKHRKKKKKWGKKPETNQVSYSLLSSPVVITIDSDSDKASEIQDNTECDSNISWSPPVPLPQNERQTESPSSVLEARDGNCDTAAQAENANKESSVTPTRNDVGDETLNGAEQPQGTGNARTPSVTDNSSAPFGPGHELSNGETESLAPLPTNKASLLRLSKLSEHSCQLDLSKQNV